MTAIAKASAADGGSAYSLVAIQKLCHASRMHGAVEGGWISASCGKPPLPLSFHSLSGQTYYRAPSRASEGFCCSGDMRLLGQQRVPLCQPARGGLAWWLGQGAVGPPVTDVAKAAKDTNRSQGQPSEPGLAGLQQPIKRTRSPSTRRPAKSWPVVQRTVQYSTVGQWWASGVASLNSVSSVTARAARSCRTLKGAPPSARLSLPGCCSPPCAKLHPMVGRGGHTLASLEQGPPVVDPGLPQLFPSHPSRRLSSSADLLSSCRASPGRSNCFLTCLATYPATMAIECRQRRLETC
ncbi:hypothetical protein N431DRAFT_35716 [Stipitochalara longipes BDJ]|nr:hypothetical protein N431DRAFT_35716 [Stipitochalara longipes BDJ]